MFNFFKKIIKKDENPQENTTPEISSIEEDNNELKETIEKTGQNLVSNFLNLFNSSNKIDDDTLDEMTGEMSADVIPEISDVMKEGLAIIDSIAINNKIACPCGKCELTLRLCRSGITVSCGACGASEFIKIENQDDIRNFKLRKSIKLI